VPDRPPWAPPQFDLSKPSASRVYDYLLGGSHNFEVDREMADRMLRLAPEAAVAAQANRDFLGRAVRYLVSQGIRQFLDIGSGIPTVGNVHEIAHRYAPEARVAYVDIDPVAIIHSRHILAGNPRCRAVEADLRQPEQLLAEPMVRELLDFDQPVAVLLVAVLHFMQDSDQPGALVARLREALVPGGHLVISHASFPPANSTEITQARRGYERTTTPLVLRAPDEITGFFDGLTLVEPGLVTVARWRPDTSQGAPTAAASDRLPALAAVGVRP
jgi:SAM-dependent methyltransferase